jgi:hypothetical protein
MSTQTVQKAIKAFQNMDEVAIANLLYDDGYFLNAEKPVFLSLLKRCFYELKAYGNDSLSVFDGMCDFSKNNCKSYVFQAYLSQHYIKLNLTFVHRSIHSITECYCPPDKNEDVQIDHQIFMDPSQGAPF